MTIVSNFDLFARERDKEPVFGSPPVKNHVCIALVRLVAAGWGCAHKRESGAAVVDPGSNAVLVAADTDPVRQFLADLEAQPAEKRKNYVDSHPERAARAAKSGDPQISERFYSLLMPKIVLPTKP